MADEEETIEDIAASVLNGVMVFLLGAALATLLVWQALAHRDGLVIGLDISTFVAISQSITAAIFSFLMLRWGVRTVRTGLTAIRRQRR